MNLCYITLNGITIIVIPSQLYFKINIKNKYKTWLGEKEI